MPAFPVIRSMRTATLFHLGSIAFGSFVIAIIQARAGIFHAECVYMHMCACAGLTGPLNGAAERAAAWHAAAGGNEEGAQRIANAWERCLVQARPSSGSTAGPARPCHAVPCEPLASQIGCRVLASPPARPPAAATLQAVRLVLTYLDKKTRKIQQESKASGVGWRGQPRSTLGPWGARALPRRAAGPVCHPGWPLGQSPNALARLAMPPRPAAIGAW
jgi:hypothetical protein